MNFTARHYDSALPESRPARRPWRTPPLPREPTPCDAITETREQREAEMVRLETMVGMVGRWRGGP